MDHPIYAGEFEWDEHNIRKIWTRHKVGFTECEEIFFDEKVTILPDVAHSQTEPRMLALGKAKSGKLLFVVFTLRKGKVRVISARDMSRRERRIYHEGTKENPQV